MPWIELSGSITIGKVTFWNFSRESRERILDAKLRKRLARHFRSYRSINRTPSPITICSFDGKSFYTNLNADEYDYLREAITALAFGSTIQQIENRIQKKQKHSAPPSMNAFEVISRRLDFNSDSYSHVTLSLMDLGMTESSIAFQKPLGARGDVFVSAKWSKYLSAYLGVRSSNKRRSRISRSLEFFRLAQAQDDFKDYSMDSAFLTRTVLLATAFESLIFHKGREASIVNGKSIRKGLKAEFFANYIDERFKLPRSLKSTRNLENNNKKKPRRESLALISWWAYDFYKLRNAIVHGDKVSLKRLRFKKEHWFSQMDIAVLVFADCLEDIIIKERILKPPRDKWQQLADTIFEKRGVDNWQKHHEVLGWLRSARTTNRN